MAEKKLNGTVIVTYRCNARCSMCIQGTIETGRRNFN